MLYYTWCIKDKDGNTKKELKLRLTSRAAVELENRIGGNPLNELMAMQNGRLPTTRFIAENLKASLQKFEHGFGENEVYDLLDEYTDDGGTLMELVPVLIEVYKVSGFFKTAEKKK